MSRQAPSRMLPRSPPLRGRPHQFPEGQSHRRWDQLLQRLVPFLPGFSRLDYCAGIIFHGTAVALPLWNPATGRYHGCPRQLCRLLGAVRPVPARGSDRCSQLPVLQPRYAVAKVINKPFLRAVNWYKCRLPNRFPPLNADSPHSTGDPPSLIGISTSPTTCGPPCPCSPSQAL